MAVTDWEKFWAYQATPPKSNWMGSPLTTPLRASTSQDSSQPQNNWLVGTLVAMTNTTQQIIIDALKKTTPSKEGIPVYKSLGLLPKDFETPVGGMKHEHLKNWESWLMYYGGPEDTGVRLTAKEVTKLRTAVKNAVYPYKLSSEDKAVLTKVGLRPSDFYTPATPDTF